MARKTELGLAETETVIGAGVKVKGTLVSEGDITIDGDLKGSIKAGGNLIIGPGGTIEANVSARNVRIGGLLVGNIKSDNETVIEGTGKVTGNINTGLLSIEHGAIFSGETRMHGTGSVAPEVTDAEA